jgi:hypothetical protein
MQHFQPDHPEDKHDNSLYEHADVLLDVVTEPQAIGELIGLVGEGTQYGGNVVFEASCSVLELLGELLSGLLS